MATSPFSRLLLVTFFDDKGQRLQGGEPYRLRVPADVLVTQFWSVTIYDHETAALIRNVPRVGLDSYDTKARKNADGSVDVYFGPKAPAGKENNWIQTVPAKSWWIILRLYGPLDPWFDKTWRPGDIELMK